MIPQGKHNKFRIRNKKNVLIASKAIQTKSQPLTTKQIIVKSTRLTKTISKPIKIHQKINKNHEKPLKLSKIIEDRTKYT